MKACGKIHLFRRNQSVHLTSALTGERVGLREVEFNKWLVTFADVDMGIVDALTGTLEKL